MVVLLAVLGIEVVSLPKDLGLCTSQHRACHTQPAAGCWRLGGVPREIPLVREPGRGRGLVERGGMLKKKLH